jgi:CBS domain-containing protein
MKTLKQLLAEKTAPLAVTSPDETVYQALCTMAEHNVGALLVLQEGKLVGIFSERDYARKQIRNNRSSKETPVRDLMSSRVAYVGLNTALEECMSLMTEKRFRHLPVLDDQGQVLGILSIGDLVKETISAQKFLIEELERYIAS